MTLTPFRAMIVREIGPDQFEREIATRTLDDLPAGDILIKVTYSSLNYKDALSAVGNRGVTRRYPHTPGIDAAGVVDESTSPVHRVGDPVLVTGYDLGMNTPGGFGQFIRVPAEWVVKLPPGLSLKQSMTYGTAGFAAGQAVLKLVQYGIKPDQGKILVTGASGGVGSMAVSFLANLGYRVVASSGKEHAKSFLMNLGAHDVISRTEITDLSAKPLLGRRWAGVVDTVGGPILSTAIRSMGYRGAVACCGNVASPEFFATVYPFILRGIALFGVDSANCPMGPRLKIWEKLSTDWKINHFDQMTTEISLNDLSHSIGLMLQSELKGRVVINLDT